MQTFKIEKSDTQCVVTWQHFDGVFIVFSLFFWIAGWAIGCVALAIEVFVNQKLELLFLATIFCGCWMYGFALLANRLFGKTKLVLDEYGLKSIYTCLFVKCERRIDLAAIHQFVRHGRRRYPQPALYQLRMVCRSNNIDYIVPSGGKALDDLCEQLNAFLETLKQSRKGVAKCGTLRRRSLSML